MRRLIILIVSCAALVALLIPTLRTDSDESTAETTPDEAQTAEALVCDFAEGDRAAFHIESRVALKAGDADRFAGTLSWEVEQASQQGALLRAALRNVTLDQDLSTPAERVDAARIEAGVFTITVDRECRFTQLTFDDRFDVGTEQLVRNFLGSVEVVLDPAAAQWSAPQEDGLGSYLARYVRRGTRVERTKDTYDTNALARQMGVTIQVLGSRLRADLHPTRHWMRRVVAREKIALTVADQPTRVLEHHLRVERDDAAFVAVVQGAALPKAAIGRPAGGALTGRSVDPAVAALSREQAQARFLELFETMGRSAVLSAAQLLADWLRAHPDETFAWLDALRAGSIDAHAQAAFFLGFELCGTPETRDALAAAVLDEAFSEMNRARAASALADHGEPTELAAGLLRQQVRESDSELVANVSLLSLGTLSGRADGELKGQLQDFLTEQMAAADGVTATVAALDAISNSGDAAFTELVTDQLAHGQPLTRQHAAQALVKVAPDRARDALLGHLDGESDLGVRVTVLQNLATLPEGRFSEADQTLAAGILADGSPAERAAAIDWLGKTADPQTRRALLARHFHSETNAQLLQRIGRFVTADDLRVAAVAPELAP